MKRSLLWLLVLCSILIPSENTESGIVNEGQYTEDYEVNLLVYKNVRTNGTFIYEYVLSDGTSHQTNGTIKDVNGTNLIIVQGRYKWELADGIFINILYEADENGFRIIKTETYTEDRIISPKSVGSLLG